jgi:hypothetical protein
MAPATRAALAARSELDHEEPGSTSSHQATEVLTPWAPALAKASRAVS